MLWWSHLICKFACSYMRYLWCTNSLACVFNRKDQHWPVKNTQHFLGFPLVDNIFPYNPPFVTPDLDLFTSSLTRCCFQNVTWVASGSPEFWGLVRSTQQSIFRKCLCCCFNLKSLPFTVGPLHCRWQQSLFPTMMMLGKHCKVYWKWQPCLSHSP